jgi:hemerythrin
MATQSAPLISWSAEEFGVGITEIDAQHQQWIDWINQLHFKLLDGNSSPKDVEEALEKVRNYTIFHFQSEEAYMALINYPKLESHRREHQFFISKVQDLYQSEQQGDFIIASELMKFTVTWLSEHIKTKDKLIEKCPD